MNALTTIEPETFDLPTAGSLSLALPETLSFEAWQHVGRELAAREKVLNWWIGDWWAFGEHVYGERAKVAAEGVFGKAFQTIANAASVCRSIETSRRREALDWSHHAEVAPLARQSAEAAEMLLDRAEREQMTVAQVRAAVRVLQGREIEQRAEPDRESLGASVIRLFNRLPDVELKKEVATAIGAVSATGFDVDPDTWEPIQ